VQPLDLALGTVDAHAGDATFLREPLDELHVHREGLDHLDEVVLHPRERLAPLAASGGGRGHRRLAELVDLLEGAAEILDVSGRRLRSAFRSLLLEEVRGAGVAGSGFVPDREQVVADPGEADRAVDDHDLTGALAAGDGDLAFGGQQRDAADLLEVGADRIVADASERRRGRSMRLLDRAGRGGGRRGRGFHLHTGFGQELGHLGQVVGRALPRREHLENLTGRHRPGRGWAADDVVERHCILLDGLH